MLFRSRNFMIILVTGGAGFIGRWVVKNLLDEGHKVTVVDNLSNGQESNIEEFFVNKDFEFVNGDIRNADLIDDFISKASLCIHLAAQINVQESLDFPERAYENNVLGTYNLLESCRKFMVKMVVVGTCMVYDTSSETPINENHRITPASPYAGSKIAAEEMALSYYHGFGLPIVIVRPFNTYGPYQKQNTEGGVASIFINRFLEGKKLQIYGDGKQTRDLLYVEDCANFIVRSSFEENVVGEVINAGTGKDVSINNLAEMICKDESRIEYIPHHHPQAEIQRLVCDYTKAKNILGWEPKTSLEEGIRKTTNWIEHNLK